MQKTFTEIYENKIWGDNQNPYYCGSSGGGSSLDFNKDNYIPFLRKFIKENGIKSVVDLGCGDFICGETIYGDLDVKYTGCDVYRKIIEHNSKKYQQSNQKYTFVHLDFYNAKETISGGDMCIIKDVLQHWPSENIYRFLDYIVESKKFKYILICNCSNQDKDDTQINIGDFRHLSCDYLPLKKYAPVKLLNYHTKEVSVIRTLSCN